MAIKTATLRTDGMHCGSCAMLVDLTVNELPGVDSSVTDLGEASTIVTYDDAVTSVDAIIAAIKGAGYDATPRG